MKLQKLLLPSIALGGAALLVAPETSFGTFSVTGESLSISQRDFRVFDNFADSQANNNTTAHYNFPGQTGAEMALWKGVIEWQSDKHGDGAGDTTQTNLGGANANFDPAYMGVANGVGGSNNNILSAKQTDCCPGVLAFTELPAADGWRIRFCDNEWTWADGPGGVTSSQFDIQGVGCHEYGHALGLGHSCDGGATMFFAVSAGDESIRSTNPDDRAGVQSIYGFESTTKPKIQYIEPDSMAGTLTIVGEDFSPTGNDVWFTNSAVTSTAGDPRVIVTDVDSTGGGTQIIVTIPAGAGVGDVLVQKDATGNSSLSNAFPSDFVTATGTSPLDVTSVSPTTVDALIPGTAQTVTITGVGFDEATSLDLDGDTIDSSRYTIVDDTSITLDMPQANQLGNSTITVHADSLSAPVDIEIAAPATAQLQVGNGDAMNVVTTSTGVDVIWAGTPGAFHFTWYSTSGVASVAPEISLDIGNNFTELFTLQSLIIPAKGWETMSFPINGPISNATFWAQTANFDGSPFPIPVSNSQSILVPN